MRSVFAIRGFDREKLQVRDTLVNIQGKRDDQGEDIEFAGRVRKQPPLREHRASPMAATGKREEKEKREKRERETENPSGYCETLNHRAYVYTEVRVYLPVARSSLTHLDCRSHVGGVGGVHDGFPDNGAKKNGGKIVEETKKCAGGERGVDEVKKKRNKNLCDPLTAKSRDALARRYRPWAFLPFFAR